MYIHDLNPLLIKIGLIEIRWYSLAYIFGIILGWWLGKKLLRFKIKENYNHLSIKIFDDFISQIIIAIILGGRLGYVIFYNLNYYLKNPLDIIKIWEGGMSFHGALIGIIFSTYIFAKNKKIDHLLLLDILACVSPIGLFFGRIANFVNAELYGKPAEVFWSVIFPTIDNLPRHPSQIYEALLEGIFLFVIINFVMLKKEIKNGICASLFLILYGFFRIFAEQFREPDIHIGYFFNFFSMGSILSILMVICGFIIFKKINNESIKRNF